MQRGLLDSATRLNEPVDPEDRFAYGWRYVNKTLRNGSKRTVQVPLTLEDILHPQEEDFRVLSDPHWRDVRYLSWTFECMLAMIRGAIVLADCRVAWDRQGKYAHGPDIAVVFNVRKRKRWSTFNCIRERTRPSLIIEVTSPSTRSTDLSNKMWEYAEQKIPHYVIVDAHETPDSRELRIIDYHLADYGEYVSHPAGPDGRVWLEEVKLWLGSEDGQVICYDADGNRKPTMPEMDQELKASKQRATEAEQHIAVLEARLRELEARTHGTNGDSRKSKPNGSR